VNPSPLLQLEGLRYAQGGRTILDIPALEVAEGETLAILGATGAGKSTLLRLMNFLLTPQQGLFLWRGVSVPRPVPLSIRRRVAMAFQEPLLFQGTVFQNVAYGLALRGLRGATIQSKVDEMLHLFHIDHLRHRSTRHLSGGEAQRTALARALVIEPELLLLDEPLASLDLPTKEQLAGELKHLLDRRRLTCAYVTHDQEEAVAIADRIAVLENGHLEQLGAPEEIFYHPRTPFVARFVRTGNVLPGVVEHSQEGLAVIRLQERRLEAVSDIPVGRQVWICLRPEDILLSREEKSAPSRDSARNHLAGVITAMRPNGPTTQVTLDCGFPLLALITRRSALDLSLALGDRLVASFKATALHLIEEGETEKR